MFKDITTSWIHGSKWLYIGYLMNILYIFLIPGFKKKLGLTVWPFRRTVRNPNYKWAKRTKFLLAVIYRLPRRHSKSSKNLWKKSEKSEINWYAFYSPYKSFKTMDRSDCKALDGLLIGKYKRRDRDVKFGHNLYSSLNLC